MSVMQAIFGAFNKNNQQSNQPVQPGNLPVQNTNPASPNNPTVPAAGVVATANTPNNGPDNKAPEGLDKFKDMWTVSEAEKPKAPESAFAGVTPEAIKEVAGKTDFSKVITPEMMTVISAGGEQGVAAMMQAMNAVAQQTYAQSAESNIKLIEAAVAKEREQFQASLPSLIKQQNVSDTLRNTNPIFNHPAAAPMLRSLQEQIQLKNPTATADQIKQQAQEFLVSFATAANPPKAEDPAKQAVKLNTDFSGW